MKRVCWSLTLLLVLPAVSLASWTPIGEALDPVSVSVVESVDTRTVLEYRIGGFEMRERTVDGVSYTVVELPGEAKVLELGFPDLPCVCRSVVIPDDARMDVRVVDRRTEDLSVAPVLPSKGNLLRTVDPADVPYVFDEFYNADGWYPADVVSHRDPYIFRDFRGMTVVFNPFQFNPATGTLRVTTYLKLEVFASGHGSINIIERQNAPLRRSRDFEQIYGDRFVNYTATAAPVSIAEEPGDMLVITHDAFHTAVEPLVQWKNEMGIRTRVFDVSGISMVPVEIKDFIRAYRDTVPGLVYVLLVGDGAEVPPMHAAGGASDPRFSLLDGSDAYPELLVGRLSAQTAAQAETQVERSINYEKFPQSGAAWYHRGTGIGSAEGPGDDGEDDWEHIDNIRADLLAYTYTEVDQIYDPGASASSVSAALNSGRGILNYCGHGSLSSWGTTGFSSAWVNALTNDHMLPFIFDVACVNGNFENYTCFAEAWMRATHDGNPTGAIGIYASSINQSWNPPMAAQDESNDLLVQDAERSYGGLCYNGSVRMMDEYGYDGEEMFKTWNVFGDPSLRVRTDTPSVLSVLHEGTMDSRSATYTVTVSGVEGALCGLSYNGAFIGSALTDPVGVAVIDIQAALPEDDEALLTVTAYNGIPVQGSVTVTRDPTDVAVPRGVREELALAGNYPNPFNPTTTVGFSIPAPSRVKMDVYSVTGAHIRTLADRTFDAGTHQVMWDGTGAAGEVLPAGVYLCRMTVGDRVMTHKMVMAK